MSRSRTILTHLLYWLLFITAAMLYQAAVDGQGTLTLGAYCQQFTSLYTYEEYGRVIITFYLSLGVFTRYFYPRNLPVLFLQVVGLGFLDSTAAFVIDQKIIGPLTGQWLAPRGIPLTQYLTSSLTASWLYVVLAFVLKHLRDHFQNEALRHEKNAIELAYLKSQLNPHFLFNSMNNLYGLALTEPARTPDAILKLSELMRYMLYESNETYVALAREIDYLTSYIALEKLRHEGETHVNFRVEGDAGAGRQIAPLLLISFVENAFKHGSVHNPARPIQLRLTVEPDRISFTAENQVIAKNKDQVGGVGLASVRRRLALLYPGRHQLRIIQEADTFRCALTLDTPADTTEATAPAVGVAPRPALAPSPAPARPANPSVFGPAAPTLQPL